MRVFMQTDSIYDRETQCLALPPPLSTPHETKERRGHTGPIHQWRHLLSHMGPPCCRWYSVPHPPHPEEVAVLSLLSFAFWPPALFFFPPFSLPSPPCASSSFLPLLSPQLHSPLAG